MQLGIFGCLENQFPEHAQRFVVVSQTYAGSRIDRAERPVLRLDLQQSARLLQRALMFMAPGQHAGVVITGDVIIGSEHQRALEQEFRIVQHIEPDADLSQQAHGLDMIRMRLQEAAQQPLRCMDVSLR